MMPAPQRRLLDDGVLQRARATLERRLTASDLDDPGRDSLVEALLWIDRGVYGACSVCGDGLSASQVDRDPADKVCKRCRDAISRRIASLTASRASAREPVRTAPAFAPAPATTPPSTASAST